MDRLTTVTPESSHDVLPEVALAPAPSATRGARASSLWALWRLSRASWALSWILASYLVQKGFARAVGQARAAARWDRVHARNARRLYGACVRLRGVYIKMGQVLSIMGTFLPAAYVRELESLQDKVPARRFKHIDRALTAALGAGWRARFQRFDEEPVAAASLGQVHRAVTAAGDEVAVKVLYPDVKAIMQVDLKVIGWALRVYRWFMPIGQLDSFHTQLTEMLEQETDLGREARCLREMAANFAPDPDVLVPTPYPALSTETVLTMSFMSGVKVNDRDGLARLGLAPQAVARKLVEMFYKQVFFDGFFHADPHPGNFFAQRGPDGQARIVVLDLGSATPAHKPLVDGMMTILGGFLARDDRAVMSGVEEMGFVSETGDRALLEGTVKQYFEKLLNLEIDDLSAVSRERALDIVDPGLKRRELRRLMRSIRYPEGWFYLERAAVILFGLSSQLAPKLNLVQVGFPYIARYLARRGR